MRRFYEQSLWIPQKFLFTNLDLHHGFLGIWPSVWDEIAQLFLFTNPNLHHGLLGVSGGYTDKTADVLPFDHQTRKRNLQCNNLKKYNPPLSF